jgi:hypothetical protein
MNIDAALQEINKELPSIGKAFELMGIAEEEIKAAKKKFPSRSNEIHGAFLGLCPKVAIEPELYRGFAREVLDQVGRGQKRSATCAECAAVLSNLCLRVPIARDFAVAYWLAMKEVFGDAKMTTVIGMDKPFTDEDIREGHERLEEVKMTINRRLPT